MAAATTTSSVVLLAVAAFLAVAAAHAAHIEHHHGKPPCKTGDLVTNSCANVRAYDWSPQLSRKMCESTLRSHKKSTTAKTERDLVLVAMDLLQSAAAKVDGVLRHHSGAVSRHNKSAALALQYCRLDCAAVARTVPMCRAMVREYKHVAPPNFSDNDGDYYDCVARLGNAAANCWGYVLVDDELAKLVSKEVVEVFQRATLVRAMMEVMNGFRDPPSVPEYKHLLTLC